MSQDSLRDTRAALWSGHRFVVVDTETTGLTGSDRVISVSLCEVIQGRIQGTTTRLIDPHLEYIGAFDVHHIDNETLQAASAKGFDEFVPLLTETLTPYGDETVVLCGFKVDFDAIMLQAEMRRLGLDLPDIELLDAKVFAEHFQVNAKNLQVLTESLGMAPRDDWHTSHTDAIATAEALLRLGDRLTEQQPNADIGQFTIPFDRNMYLGRTGRVRRNKAPQVLTPEHEEAHNRNLSVASSRDKSLSYCVEHDCSDLVSRFYDAITGVDSAREVTYWIHDQLERTDVSRQSMGLLLSGLATTAAQVGDPELVKSMYAYLRTPARPDPQTKWNTRKKP